MEMIVLTWPFAPLQRRWPSSAGFFFSLRPAQAGARAGL